MMKNETGNTYGRLTVIEHAYTNPKRGAYFKCICECGRTTVVRGHNLRKGKTKSCGCLVIEEAKKMGHIQGLKNTERLCELNRTEEHKQQAKEAATVHGGSGERLYRIWSHLRERCNSETGDHAKWYHDKGVKVCEEWNMNYSAFREWAYNNGYHEQPEDTGYKNKLSIDRIDPEGNYCPENCRWITVSENSIARNQYYANQNGSFGAKP